MEANKNNIINLCMSTEYVANKNTYADTIVNIFREPLVFDPDSLPETDTVIRHIREHPSETEKKADTIPELFEQDLDSLITRQDTLIDTIRTPEKQVLTEPAQAQPTITPTRIFHPDSIYTVEVAPEYFEGTDSIFATHEPATEYFGEHYLMPQNQVKQLEKAESVDWAFPLLILSLLFVAIAKQQYFGRFKQIISASLASRFFNQMEREGNLFDERITLLLFANFLLVFSMLTFQTLQYFSVLKSLSLAHPLIIVSVSMLVFIFFFVLKYYLLVFLGWVFKSITAARVYLKNILIFNMLIGVMLLPFVFINLYLSSDIFLFCAWGVFIMANILKALRGILLGYNATHFSGYYLILYLCGVEIVPLLLIYKISVDYYNATIIFNQSLSVVLNMFSLQAAC